MSAALQKYRNITVNERNLITGTRYLNVSGMLPWENQVAEYIKETGDEVMYRVTPVYRGNDLLACGVQMEAESLGSDEIEFNVFVFNVQPGLGLIMPMEIAGLNERRIYMVHEKIKIQAPGSAWQGDLYTYFLDNSKEMRPNRKRPVVIICPGGGYEMTSDREAEAIAVQFLAKGFHAAVLRYCVVPARYPEALLQLAASVMFLRKNAEKYHIDTEKIIIQGSSAGGHLAASLGVFWKKPFLSERLGTVPEMLRPNGLILSYPVISSAYKPHLGSFMNLLGADFGDEQKRNSISLELHVTKDTPKTFLWHTASDNTVPVENSLLFFQALHKLEIPVEMHIYPVGGHGLGLANEETSSEDGYGIQEECQSWISLACDWLKHI